MTKKDRSDWIEKYFGFLFAPRQSPKTKANARNLKEKQLRGLKSLYIYRSVRYVEEDFLPMLTSAQILKTKLSDPRYFNDPFDSRLPKEYFYRNYTREEHIRNLFWLYQMGVSEPPDPERSQECWNAYKASLSIPEDAREEWGKKVWEISLKYWEKSAHSSNINSYVTNPWEWIYNALLDTIGIRCFTEDPYSLMMWSHYAEKHQGVCLEYDVGQFLNMNEGRHISDYIHPVRYCDKCEELKTNSLYTPGDIHLSEEEKLQQFQRSLLTKAECWKSEREWRWVMLFQPESEIQRKNWVQWSCLRIILRNYYRLARQEFILEPR